MCPFRLWESWQVLKSGSGALAWTLGHISPELELPADGDMVQGGPELLALPPSPQPSWPLQLVV